MKFSIGRGIAIASAWISTAVICVFAQMSPLAYIAAFLAVGVSTYYICVTGLEE